MVGNAKFGEIRKKQRKPPNHCIHSNAKFKSRQNSHSFLTIYARQYFQIYGTHKLVSSLFYYTMKHRPQTWGVHRHTGLVKHDIIQTLWKVW